MDELSSRERALLDFERRGFGSAGAKEQQIRTVFGAGATTHYQRLNALLESQAALASDPVLVNRLRRIRAARLRSRWASARRSGRHRRPGGGRVDVAVREPQAEDAPGTGFGDPYETRANSPAARDPWGGGGGVD